MPFQPYEPPTDLTSVADLLGYANYYTGGTFTLFTLIAIWFISFAWFKRYDTKTAITGATTLTFLLSLPLSVIKFKGSPILAPEVVISLLVLTGLCAMWLWSSED